MTQANGSVERRGVRSGTTGAVGAIRRGVTRVLEGASFWGAVLLPFVAVALVVVKPAGWLPLVGGVFLGNPVALLAGHCHGLDCRYRRS